ncbi:MAG: GGDEF domain-containing protein [Polyangiaceae bacterium]|nr:GGDEF domain-containing protein [Polyangiaceae bacterium]
MSNRPLEDDFEATRVANLGELQQELAARSKRDKAYLIVLSGTNVGERYRVEGPEIVIGRASNASIRLLDDGISRRHARLLQTGRDVVIEDMGSSNGTMVNGEPIGQATLRDGDHIRLGSTTILKFTYLDRLDESLHEQMYDAAVRDGLTKAYNRKYFLDRLETEVAYARRHMSHLSLLMFDIDHFKRVNDTFGHLAGDYVLARVSKLAGGTVRTEDLFARYGGEEFAILCRGVALESAGILGERLRVLIEGAAFEHEGVRVPITVSIGVAAHPTIPVESGLQLIAAADEALYEAKRLGRNRVLLKHGLPIPL